jgi:hypothetical protein
MAEGFARVRKYGVVPGVSGRHDRRPVLGAGLKGYGQKMVDELIRSALRFKSTEGRESDCRCGRSGAR